MNQFGYWTVVSMDSKGHVSERLRMTGVLFNEWHIDMFRSHLWTYEKAWIKYTPPFMEKR